MAKSEKTNLYLLSIVGIVAVVGIVVLVLGGQKVVGMSMEIAEEETLVGQAINIKNIKINPSVSSLPKCIDSDGDITDLDYVWYEDGDISVYGHDEFTKGITSGLDKNGKYVRMEDGCYYSGEVLEGHCILRDDGSGYYVAQGIDGCGSGYECEDGTCVED